MDSPYRSGLTTHVAPAPRDSGIVGEIIGQFADRFAFYRELVQNAIDADSESVTVTAVYDQTDKVMRVAVKDSGGGMPRDIIENRLLVLFRSTKENDDTKIGKFGVGFASVLAVQPQVIRVISVCDGERLTLHLYPDLSYELFDTGRAQRSGTTVELEIPLEPGDVKEFVDSSWTALVRWCRHASVPIHFDARSAAGARLASGRVDSPLELDDALVSVRHTSEDGQMTVIVGVSASQTPYAGFFNYGLMLYETNEPLVGALSFKVQDARLGHTLSRDNVRRDGNFHRALGVVKQLARTELAAAVAQRLRDAADSNPQVYGDLIAASAAADIVLGSGAWVFPTVDATEGRTITSLERFQQDGSWVAHHATPLTAYLASQGVVVVNLRGGGSIDADGMTSILTQLGGGVRHVGSTLTLVSINKPTGVDERLLAETKRLLDECFRLPTDIHFGSLFGADDHRPWIPIDNDISASSFTTDIDRSDRNPFFLLRRLPVVLNVNTGVIRRLRARADSDLAGAATLLTRLLLLDRAKLTTSRSEQLLEQELDAHLGEIE